MGLPRSEVSDKEIVKVNFNNGLGEIIIPESVDIEISENKNKYNITSEPRSHSIGYREGGTLQADWKIENEMLIVIGGQTAGSGIITQVFKFQITKLTTSEKSYSKFVYRTM